MKNIYDLLNQAEDNEDILSENERMEMTDIEKRRIYNRILLDSEEEQEEQSCNEQKKYQDNEKAQQVEGGRNIESEEHENRQKQAKRGRTVKKLLTAAACMNIQGKPGCVARSIYDGEVSAVFGSPLSQHAG